MRTLDATAFNLIADHPEVRPWLGFRDPKHVIDLAPMVGNPNNFAFLTPQRDGGYILLRLHPGLYVAHTLAMPSARGRPMLKLMRQGFAAMFLAGDAVEIVTQVPDGNHGALSWSQAAGFRPTFRREGCFFLMGEMVGAQHLSLTYQDWACGHASNRNVGQFFHEKIAQAVGPVSHPEDPVHDAMVGATIGACIEGNVVKGVGLYNRYAAVAGYAQAKLISVNPPVVDTGEAVLGLENGEMVILSAHARSASSITG